jgi:SAM-dependent methyltransferase
MEEKLSVCPVCEGSDFSHFLQVKDYFLSQEDFSIVQCNGCGFKFVTPRPNTEDIGGYYQSDEYISHDAKKVNFISRIYKMARVFSIKSKYRIVKNVVNQGEILDIGCGTGEFLGYCQLKGFKVAGIEPNEKAGNYAREINRIRITQNLRGLSVADGRFNAITMWHVLEHVHDLNETLERVKALLAPGGVFIIAVPNCNSWDARNYGKFWAAYDVPRHLYHFIDVTLNKLITKHGFEIQKTIPQKLDAFYVSMLSEKYRSGKNKYVKALFSGLWSNFKAGSPETGYSSQIFVCKVKKT